MASSLNGLNNPWSKLPRSLDAESATGRTDVVVVAAAAAAAAAVAGFANKVTTDSRRAIDATKAWCFENPT